MYLKKLLNILVLFSIILTIFMPLTYIKADTNTYSVVSIKSDGSINELGSYNDYNSAFNKMKEYNSNVNDVAVIRKNGKIVYTSYGIFRPSTSNSTIKIYSDNGSYLSYISPSYNSDTLFLDYNPSTNKVKIMISGLTGWVSLDQGDIHPISYITDGTSSTYDKNKKYVKILYPNGIRLREGAGTDFKQVGCNGAHTCSSQDGGIWASGSSIYEWLNYGNVTNDGTNDWYQVNINGNIGYIANEVATKDLEEFNPNIGQKQDFNTYYYVTGAGELYHSYYATVASAKVWTTKLGKSPLYLKEGVRYYSFDGNYFYDDFTKLVNDLRNGNYKNAINKMPYYNYYQYLPTRTQTHYNAENLNTYIGYDSKIDRSSYYQLVYNEEKKQYKWTAYGDWDSFPKNQSMLYDEGNSFIASQEKYGVNAAQTLALAINESGWGRSYTAVREYNIFGHGAFDSAPDEYAASYESITAGIMAHAFNYIAKDYANPINGSHYYGSHYGNKLSGNNVSYASDAYWGEKMAGNYYNLDKYFGFQDFSQRAILGMKQTSEAAPVYKEPSTKSTKYYNLKGISNIPVTILDTVIGEEINGNNVWYKIQSDLPIDENRNLIDINLGTYNFDTSYAYIHSSYIYKESSEPVIYASDVTINSGSKFDALSGVTAYDAWDGDVTNKLKVSENNVNTSKAGNYTVTYKATDSENNDAIKSITVTVLSSKPVIYASDITVNMGNTINLLDGVTAEDFEDGNLTNKVIVSANNVDFNKIGTYEVTYSVTDSDKNTTTKTIKVNVTLPEYKETDGLFYFDSLKEASGNLHIKGFLSIVGVNNNLDNSIKYNLILKNEDTGIEISKSLNRITNKDNMPFNIDSENGIDYTYSWFEGDINIDDLSNGNYSLYITANDNEYITRKPISNVFGATMVSTFKSSKKTALIRNNYESRDATVQLFIRDSLIGEKTSNSKYNINNEYSTIKFVNNNLVIKGASHIIGGDYADGTNVSRKLILENTETFEQISYDIGSITNGDYKVELRVPDGFDKTRAWFETNIDISNLSKGTYVIYIATSSNLSDYGELQDIFSRKINESVTIGDKHYTFSVNKEKRYRIELNVS